jgi:hypothetical protein
MVLVKSASLGRREQAHGYDNDDVTAQRNEAGIESHDGIVPGEPKSNEDQDASHNSSEDTGHGHSL